jgi:hypothetical protein
LTGVEEGELEGKGEGMPAGAGLLWVMRMLQVLLDNYKIFTIHQTYVFPCPLVGTCMTCQLKEDVGGKIESTVLCEGVSRSL